MFDEFWDDTLKLTQNGTYIPVQEKEELRVVYHLMKGMESYLEIGASNGHSLWVLGNALAKDAEIHVIDLGEEKSIETLKGVMRRLDRNVHFYQGRSQDIDVEIPAVDCVLIDAAHDYDSVKADYEKYGYLAKKLLLFHDIQTHGPFEVFHETGGGLEIKVTRFSGMGYGVRFP